MNIYRQRSLAMASIFASVVFLSGLGQAHAATAAEVDAKVASALTQFRKETSGADGFLKEAKAVLVIPDVKKVGFVIAGQWGTGALQVGGQTIDYYKMTAGSAGFQAGYQQAHFVFIFFTQEAVDKFRDGEGWTVGGEAGLTLVEVGAGVSADTLKNQNAVAGFAFSREGLMAGWSAKGTKFERVKLH
ncbi:MAG: hypothetical protein EHM68_16700 [Lysobacterales bacterium]|nr:MAG: hypothetical protein EHM68_16700 [Xanthomonadales bacterium]